MARMSDPEPVLWTLFGAGGMVNAFFLPAHIIVFGLLLPLGIASVTHADLLSMAQNPLGKLYLLIVIPLPLFHFAHRFRFTLRELGLQQLDMLLSVLLYGGAILMSVLTATIVLGL